MPAPPLIDPPGPRGEALLSRTGTADTPFRRFPFFYGWIVVSLSMSVSVAAAPSGQIFMGIMLKPLTEELGWSRSIVAAGMTVGTVAAGLLAPLAGALADRYGARFLTPAAAVAVVTSFLLLAGMDSLWQFYLGYAVCRSLSHNFLSGVTPMTSAANWFQRKRGRAMGLVGMAFPLGGSLTILLGQLILEQAGWRTVFVVSGLAVATIGIVPPALLIRRRPEDVGLLPDGATSPVQPETRSGSGEGPRSFTMREAIRTRTFWLMTASLTITTLATGALSYHMPAYLTDRGVAAGVAAAALSAFALSGAVSMGLWGFLSERVSERTLATGAMVLAAVFTISIAQVRVDVLAIPAGAGLGLVARGEGALLNMMLARYFGRGSFGKLSGAMQPFQLAALGSGPLLASLRYDAVGSYDMIFVAAVVLFLSGAVLISQARPPTRPSHENLVTATA